MQVAVAQLGLARTHRDCAPIHPDLAGNVGNIQRIGGPQHQVGALADSNTADLRAESKAAGRD